MNWLDGIFVGCAVLGLGQAMAGWLLARRFAAQPARRPITTPGVSVLKPLHGDEPQLEAALASFCAQDFAPLQIVFGVQDTADPALAVVARLRTQFPAGDIAVVINPAQHGQNRKISNLINMLPSARHDVLVIADADIHAAPDYLSCIVAALEAPGVGLVTTLYTGLPGQRGWVAMLGTSWINHCFLPGALLARALGRQDCLGATMALRRETLARIGGLEKLVDHLADDNVLGRQVRALGMAVALATTVPATTVAETSLRTLWRHELRWARTIRALEPAGFAASVLQHKLFWAALALGLAPNMAGLGVFSALWAGAALAARGVDRALGLHRKGLAFTAPLWLLPLRELMSVGIWLASYAGTQVDWRGHRLRAARAPTPGGDLRR